MNSLGHRVDSWGGAAAAVPLLTDADTTYATSNQYTPGKHAQSAIMNLTVASPYSFDMSTFRGTPATAVGQSTIAFESPFPSGGRYPSNPPKKIQKPVLSELLTKHAGVIRRLTATSHGHGDASHQEGLCAALAASFSIPLQGSSKSAVIDGLSKHDMIAYKDVLTFLSYITAEDVEKVPAGYFSAICFDTDVLEQRSLARRESLSSGAMRFLELQMWQQWSRAVDEAVACGDLKVPPSESGHSRQQRLKAFVLHQTMLGLVPQESLRTVCSPSGSSAPVSLWAFVYHSIRIGDVASAIKELQRRSSSAAGNDSVESNVVFVLTNYESGVLDILERQFLHFAVNKCYGSYIAEMRVPEGQRDVYKAFVLGLVSVSKIERGFSVACPIPEPSLEDFMWTELWLIQSSRRLGIPMKTPLSPISLQRQEDEDNFDLPPPKPKYISGYEYVHHV